MKRREIGILFILFFSVLFLASLVFSQEIMEGTEISEEDSALMEELDEGVLTGKVLSLDESTGIINVEASDGSKMAFSVVEGETILWRGIEDIGLSDIKEGEIAEVGYYTDEKGKLIASWVDVLIEEEEEIANPEIDSQAEPEMESAVELAPEPEIEPESETEPAAEE